MGCHFSFKNLSTHPPPGGHCPSIIFPSGSWRHTGNFRVFFPFGFFPVSLIYHFFDNHDLHHQPSIRNSNRLSLSQTFPFILYSRRGNQCPLRQSFPFALPDLFALPNAHLVPIGFFHVMSNHNICLIYRKFSDQYFWPCDCICLGVGEGGKS
jgi:hypothetical protein